MKFGSAVSPKADVNFIKMESQTPGFISTYKEFSLSRTAAL